MYITIDIGGSNIRMAAFSSLFRPRLIKSKTFAHLGSYTKDLKTILQIIKFWQVENKNTVKGIGICAAGKIEEEKIILSPNLLYFNNKNLVKDLKKHFKCRIKLENDLYCAALGEAVYGKRNNFLFIAWGTGIGAAEAINCKGFLKIQQFEIGHQTVPGKKIKCNCGQIDCWELYAGGEGVKKRCRKSVQKLNKQDWKKVLNYFEIGLKNTYTLRPAESVIFGGSIALNNFAKVKSVHNKIKKSLKLAKAPEKIMLSKYKDKAGLYGGLALLR